MSSYIQIGAGYVFFNPNAGNLATNPTPLRALTIQDAELDISGTIEALKGQYQFPDDTAVTDKKGTGKLTMGRKDMSLFNQIFFADTVSAGGVSVVPLEAHVIPATPFQVIVAPPSSGTFYEDLGVYYGSDNSKAFTKVATSPAAGQYSVSAGTYTFAAADTALAGGVLISYAYTLTTPGSLFQMNNQNIGWGPQLEIFMVDTYQPVVVSGANVYSTIRIWAAKINKMNLGNKRANYSMPSLDFEYFQASNGRVLDFYSNK